MYRKFDGQEVYPGRGSDFEDFILEYEQALYTESLFNESRWASQIKTSGLVNFLAGNAARLVYSNVTQWRTENIDFNYENFKGNMKPEFGCRLNQVQLCKRLTSGKRPQDSWSDYLDYLKYVSRLMTGDHSLPLLENFGAIACPDLASVLVPHIDRSNGNFLSEADRILALLVDLRGDDRKRPQIARTPESSKQHETKIRAYQQQKPQHHAGQKQQKQSHPTGQGQALAAAAKPTPKLVSYVCNKEDHRGHVRLELKKLKRLVKERGQAHNAAVTSTD
ncbi:hypothetical protein PF005_g16097 [Phytophthora fragariae]|nr:hypothetical protein PF003_g17446 [Phytophthora fragariae]KAE8932475.1 hypothetical protein PF009_g17501 [Phytophthora fragariae]KAE8994204.1 hypothetical protein PF011_g16820 [Phytophthora fragariae]KAE9097971.1 hypothetical protein PF007_g16430 [Phytophthora fragariae]KAE9132751.1 hypothetical protein PF006_g15203 [Phytophthora fragariae]